MIKRIFVLCLIWLLPASAQAKDPHSKRPAHLSSPTDYPRFTKFGPNCWNFVLVYSGALKHYRAVNLAEFWSYMSSSACQRVKSPKPGDIASLIVGAELTHSTVVLSKRKGISKGSPYPEEQVAYDDLSLLPQIPDARMIFHRCNFQDFKSRLSPTLARIEERLHDLQIKPDPLPTKEVRDMIVQTLDLLDVEPGDSPNSPRIFSILGNLVVFSQGADLELADLNRLTKALEKIQDADLKAKATIPNSR